MAVNARSFRSTVDLESPALRNAVVNGALPLQRGQWVRFNALQKGRFLGVDGNRIRATVGDGRPYSANAEFEWARANGY